MIVLVEDKREAIVALCELFGVRRLALFGSAAKGTFDPELCIQGRGGRDAINDQTLDSLVLPSTSDT